MGKVKNVVEIKVYLEETDMELIRKIGAVINEQNRSAIIRHAIRNYWKLLKLCKGIDMYDLKDMLS